MDTLRWLQISPNVGDGRRRQVCRNIQSPLVVTLTQNFMRFRCTVMEKRHQSVSPHNSVCHDLYHACTLAWDTLGALFTPHWKVLRR